MSTLDWIVLVLTLLGIVAFGTWRSRGVHTTESFLRAGKDIRWWTIGLSVIATQASAITFLSVPGQAYQDGLGFVQFYFGLPIAMVLLSAIALPVYHRLRVYTAYEYLEQRFDRRTRQFTALIFLVSRGLASGLAIYAPALVLSAVLGWPVLWTNWALGAVTIAYTVAGGSRAVSRTQTAQMAVIFVGLVLAFGMAVSLLPSGFSFGQGVALAGALGKLQGVDTSLRLDTRYTLWSGLLGGLFVQLAYFGTDQSQVQRYLAGGPLAESRRGLLMNGLLKVPMQLFILFIGVMVFVVYQLIPPPLFFNRAELERVRASHPAEVAALESRQGELFAEKRRAIDGWMRGETPPEALRAAELADIAAERMTATSRPMSPRGKWSSTKRRKMKSASLGSAPGRARATSSPVSFRSAWTRASASRTALTSPGFASHVSMACRFSAKSRACVVSKAATSAGWLARTSSSSARLKNSGGGVS